MRAYKFLSAEFGLKSLWEKRLKISTIDELNDPFDLVPFKILDRSKRKRMRLKNKRLGARHDLPALFNVVALGGLEQILSDIR